MCNSKAEFLLGKGEVCPSWSFLPLCWLGCEAMAGAPAAILGHTVTSGIKVTRDQEQPHRRIWGPHSGAPR